MLDIPADTLYKAEQRIASQLALREARKVQAQRGGLIEFIEYFWKVLEPKTDFVSGWPLEAVCRHLEAVTFGEITRLLINVPPGFMKSLATNVFWPAWEMGPMDRPSERYVSFSYSAGLTERDNSRLRDLILSPEYQTLYGKQFQLTNVGITKLMTDKTGWKLASSVGGVGTGERGTRILCFPRSELVWTERGKVPIGEIVSSGEQIRVASCELETGNTEWRSVVGWHRNPASQIVRVSFSDGSSVRCTPDHRFWGGDGWIAAGAFKAGTTTLPIMWAPNACSNIFPRSPASDTLNSSAFYPKLGGQFLTSFGALGNFYNLFFGQNGPPPRWFDGPMSSGIVNIILASAVGKIIKLVIGWATVQVSHFLTLWCGAKESFSEQYVDRTVFGAPLFSQANARITPGRGGFEQPSWDAQFMPPANCSTREAINAPVCGDGVKAFVPGNVAPHLTVDRIELCGHEDETFCLTVEKNHNFYVGGGQPLLVTNCDDAHNVKESESKTIRDGTVRWFRESMSNRLNNLQKDAIVVIMQRVHDEDVSGAILSDELGYCHLRIPMEYEANFSEPGNEGNDIGWKDPRHRDGELAWPGRFTRDALAEFKKRQFMWNGQYQQRPSPRGGGIVKEDSWQHWPAAEYPRCEYVLGVLDTAYTEKQENDPSALIIWGIFRDKGGHPKVIMLGAWEGRLDFPKLVRVIGRMCTPDGGSKEEISQALAWANEGSITYKALPRYPVDRLIIEAKANGISVAQEIKRLFGGTGDFGVELIDPKKLGGDKVARMHSVVHMFDDEMVYAPDLNFAQMVINNVTAFPKGAHDDLSDCTSAGLRYLRMSGLLERRDEHSRRVTEETTHKGRERPLY